MVFLVSFAQIVQEQCQVEHPLVGHVSIGLAQGVVSIGKLGRLPDRPQTVLVDRVFVILIELQQTARMPHGGDDLFQIAQFVEHAQRFTYVCGISEQIVKLPANLTGNNLGKLGRRQ